MDLLFLPRPLFQRTDGQALLDQRRVRVPPLLGWSPAVYCERMLTGSLPCLLFSSLIAAAFVACAIDVLRRPLDGYDCGATAT